MMGQKNHLSDYPDVGAGEIVATENSQGVDSGAGARKFIVVAGY
jgi:hypothetical protein